MQEYGGTPITKLLFELKGEFLRGERIYRVHHGVLLDAMKKDRFVLKTFLQQILLALYYLNQNLHVVHADLKPDNILCDIDNFKIKLCDFGSAFKFRYEEAQSDCGSSTVPNIEEVLDHRTFSCSKAKPFWKLYCDFPLKQGQKRNVKCV